MTCKRFRLWGLRNDHRDCRRKGQNHQTTQDSIPPINNYGWFAWNPMAPANMVNIEKSEEQEKSTEWRRKRGRPKWIRKQFTRQWRIDNYKRKLSRITERGEMDTGKSACSNNEHRILSGTSKSDGFWWCFLYNFGTLLQFSIFQLKTFDFGYPLVGLLGWVAYLILEKIIPNHF